MYLYGNKIKPEYELRLLLRDFRNRRVSVKSFVDDCIVLPKQGTHQRSVENSRGPFTYFNDGGGGTEGFFEFEMLAKTD